MSSEEIKIVIDTSVIRYFLLAGEERLLLDCVGGPIGIPRVVFDPDEETSLSENFRSEITRSIAYQDRKAKEAAEGSDLSARSIQNSNRLRNIHTLYEDKHIVVLDLQENEQSLLSSLTSDSGCRAFGLKFPLGIGEAACLAIAHSRELDIATDDNDAITAIQSLDMVGEVQRIRKLLISAATGGLITENKANEVHKMMRDLGFWDSVAPFR